jgi:hypothetical protein
VALRRVSSDTTRTFDGSSDCSCPVAWFSTTVTSTPCAMNATISISVTRSTPPPCRSGM